MAERDPVCGMMVDPAKAAGQHEYKGALYYFCNSSCLARFKASPEKFLTPSLRPVGMAGMGLSDWADRVWRSSHRRQRQAPPRRRATCARCAQA